MTLAMTGCSGVGSPSNDVATPKMTHNSQTSQNARSSYQAAPTAEQLAQYEIPADATPEQMAQTYIAMTSAIWGGNLKPTTYHEWAVYTGDDNMTSQEAADKITAAWVTPFFKTQYQSGYATAGTSLNDQYNYVLKNVAIGIKNYTGEGSVQESWTLGTTTLLNSSSNERRLQITSTEHYSNQQDPSDQNVAALNGRQSIENVTFTLSSDSSRWLISDWQPIH